MVSLLKAYYGDAPRKENDFGYDYLPKIGETDNHSWGYLFDRMYAGGMEGLISFGMNPVANGPNTPKMLKALEQAEMADRGRELRDRDRGFLECAETGCREVLSASDAAARSIETEVFLLPAACFAEKDGAFVNSSRWVQWKHAALDPPGEAKRDQEIIARLFLKLRELYEKEGGAAPEPLLDMSWNYANPASPSLEEVANEINGRDRHRHAAPRLRRAEGRRLDALRQLALFRLLHRGRQHDGAPRPGRSHRSGFLSQTGAGTGRPIGACSTTALPPTPPANRGIRARSGIRWDGKKWVGDVPDYKADAPPDSFGAFIMLPEGVAKLFAPDFVGGPVPRALRARGIAGRECAASEVSSNPVAKIFHSDLDPLGTAKDYPYVALTYRLTEHFHYWTKHVKSSSAAAAEFLCRAAGRTGPGERHRERRPRARPLGARPGGRPGAGHAAACAL